MRSTIKKIVIPFIILHLVGNMVNRAGNIINADKVNTPSSDSPYVIPFSNSKSGLGTHFSKNDMEWSNIAGHKGDVS